MKNFRLAPLALAIGSMSLCVPLATSQAAAPGDLSIYTGVNQTSLNPTLLLMLQNSDNMDDADEPVGATINLRPETYTDSDNISYLRFFFKNYTTDGPKYYTRMTRMKDAIFYLMNTPGALNENISIGLGSYGANTDGNELTLAQIDAGTGGSGSSNVIGDSSSAEIYIPARPIGPVGSPQRKAIKRYVASLCPGNDAALASQSCSGLPIGARAYADAGAYMLGTTTTRLELNPTSFQTRIFRAKDSLGNAATAVAGVAETFQYCPPAKRQIINYGYSYYRSTCSEEDWVNIDKNNAASYGIEWSFPNPVLQPNGRPVGFVTAAAQPETTSTGVQVKYSIDLTNLPDGNWGWFIDYINRNPNNVMVPPLADAAGYFGTGIRNAPPAVRADGYTYRHPSYSECSGTVQTDSSGQVTSDIKVENGIFFITGDHVTNTGSFNNATYVGNIMNQSLIGEGMTAPTNPIEVLSTSGTLGDLQPLCRHTGAIKGDDGGLSGADNKIITTNGWNCIAEYSRRLNPPATENPVTSNPLGTRIRTGVFQFVGPNRIITEKTTVKGIPAANCLRGATLDIKNMCQWGSPSGAYTGVGGYGEGGYIQSTYRNASEAAANTSYMELANAISHYADNLVQGIGMVPTGTPVVPNDPLNPNGLLATGYLPLIGPSPTKSTAQWAGNLRKYEQVGNTFFDKQSPKQSPFSATALLSPTTLDLWSSQATAYKSSQQAGGVYEKLPTSTNSPTSGRNVYLSEATSGSNLSLLAPTKTSMDAVSVTGIADQNDLRKLLLNYMGYNISSYTTTTQDTDIQNTATKATSIGGVNHSTPFALVAKPVRNATTGKIEPTKRYIVFGAMDNALHIVDDATGEERLSFIPKEVLTGMNGEQYKALTTQNTIANGPAPGVDAPWTSYAAYRSSAGADGTLTTSENLYLYGGARMGAQAYYGIDVTGIEGTSFTPKQLFTITPTSNTLFSQLGYTWAKPVITKIRWQGQPKLVAILSGGYDKKYDATDAAINTAGTAATATTGNAIYIVDAVTGAPLIVAGQGSSTSDDNKLFNCHEGSGVTNCITASAESASTTITPTNSNLKYSVAGSVKTLDRDADELADAVYFADLNGQVFRLDINNRDSKPAIPAIGASAAVNATNPSVRLVQLANLNTDTTKQGPRFYEAPTVTVHQRDNGERFVVVSLASGDRSNPLDTQPISNYIYGLYDKDVGNQRLYKSDYTLLSSGITIGKTDSNFPVSPTSTTSNYSKNGWRLPIDSATKRDGTALTDANQKLALKAFGPLAALNSKLFVSVYNPNDGATVSNCSSQVLGTTEAYQVCLPYGYCNDTTGTQYQRIRIGKGLQSIMFGNGATAGQAGRSLLVSEPPATGQTSVNISGLNTGTGVPTTEGIWNFASKLRPMLWYDMQQRKNGTATN